MNFTHLTCFLKVCQAQYFNDVNTIFLKYIQSPQNNRYHNELPPQQLETITGLEEANEGEFCFDSQIPNFFDFSFIYIRIYPFFISSIFIGNLGIWELNK